MKSMKSKKSSNSSFLSNHDLLQNFRNKSIKLITRDSSLIDIKPLPKKVSLIQKKSYENILNLQNNRKTQNNFKTQNTSSLIKDSRQNKQNDPLQSNRKKLNISKNTTYRQKAVNETDNQLNKIIKELNFVYDEISSEEIELRMILNKNIRKIKQLFSSKSQAFNLVQKPLIEVQRQMKQKIEFLQNKVQDQSKKIFRYKKQNQDLKEHSQFIQTKVGFIQQKYDQLRRQLQDKQINDKANQQKSIEEQKQMKTNRSHQNQIKQVKQVKMRDNRQVSDNQNKIQEQTQIQILKNIIQSQEQLISKQGMDFRIQNDQLLTILYSQALQMQQLILKEQNLVSEKNNQRDYSQEHKKYQNLGYKNSQSSRNYSSYKPSQKNSTSQCVSPRFNNKISTPFKTEQMNRVDKRQVKKNNQLSIRLY